MTLSAVWDGCGLLESLSNELLCCVTVSAPSCRVMMLCLDFYVYFDPMFELVHVPITFLLFQSVIWLFILQYCWLEVLLLCFFFFFSFFWSSCCLLRLISVFPFSSVNGKVSLSFTNNFTFLWVNQFLSDFMWGFVFVFMLCFFTPLCSDAVIPLTDWMVIVSL